MPPLDLLGFLQRMVALSNNTVALEFLHHHEQLWLPPSFWSVCPDGSVLAEYPWVLDLVLFQHPTEAEAPPAEEIPDEIESNEPSYRDPAPFPILAPVPAPSSAPASSAPAPAPALDIEHRPSLAQAASYMPTPAPPPEWTSPPEPDLRQKFSETTSKSDVTSSAVTVWSPRDGFVPLMVFLLFGFTSLSYLALLYHKSQMIPVVIQGSVSAQESQSEQAPDATAASGSSDGEDTAPIEVPEDEEEEFESEEESTDVDPGQTTSPEPEVSFDAGVSSPEPTAPKSIEDGGGPVPPSLEAPNETSDEPTPPKEAP